MSQNAPTTSHPGEPTGMTEVAASVRLSVMRLARILRHQDGGGLTPSMMSALATLNREGRLSLGELAAREHVAAPTVTRVVEKLQRAGLATRRASDHDGRVAYVEVTSKGRRQVEDARSRRTAWLAARLAVLSDDELAALRHAAPILERLVDSPDPGATR
ncbi:MAG: MarR family winged helix-turn-helix transcriptional regulator [Acidimicrobiales bacterium]